jgi:hypothetical protein
VAALITVGTNVTIAVATALIGQFGPAAIAGYGTGSRIEYLLIPLVFGLGGPLVAIVGTNIGAGEPGRALRTAWIGAAIAAGLCEIIGLAAAAFPHLWLSLFDDNAAMLDAGSRYLCTVGPFYGLFGLGMALYFASQGAGRLAWPLIANLTRLIIAAAGGSLALRPSGDLGDVFFALAMARAVFGVINAAAVAGGAWFGPVRLRSLLPLRRFVPLPKLPSARRMPHLPGLQCAEALGRNAGQFQRIGERNERRIDRFVGELKGAIVAGKSRFGAAIEQRLHGLGGIHMHIPHEPARFIGPDRQDCELEWPVAVPRAMEICAVAIA